MDIQHLIISRVRVKMLELFLLDPGQMYHVRKIVRLIDEEINAVRRELAHLEKHGLLSKEKRANRLLYSFRQDYPLYFELIELFHKVSGLGGDMLKNKGKLGRLKFVMISGRYARGSEKKSKTDVDLLVVGEVILPELTQIVKAEEQRRKREINYTVMSEEEFQFRKRRNDPFVLGILLSSRIMVIGDEEELVAV